MSEGTAWFVVPLPLAGLMAGILAGIVSHLSGYGFSVPAMLCVALGAAFPYLVVLQQIRETNRSVFMSVSAILAGLMILLIALGHPAPALISAVLASAWTTYFFFKTWDPKRTSNACENRWRGTFGATPIATARNRLSH